MQQAQIAQHWIGHLLAVLLQIITILVQIGTDVPKIHMTLVYNTSQASQIDHLAHSELILTRPGLFVIHDTHGGIFLEEHGTDELIDE